MRHTFANLGAVKEENTMVQLAQQLVVREAVVHQVFASGSEAFAKAVALKCMYSGAEASPRRGCCSVCCASSSLSPCVGPAGYQRNNGDTAQGEHALRGVRTLRGQGPGAAPGVWLGLSMAPTERWRHCT
eukprot:1160374-Pelagomonas_calceolata.AAC.1